jgi:hypothetical protein
MVVTCLEPYNPRFGRPEVFFPPQITTQGYRRHESPTPYNEVNLGDD